MSLSGDPVQWFVLPDPKLRGQLNVLSATSERGPYPGPTVAREGNKGLLFPLQSGELVSGAEPVVYSVAQAGGPGVGEFGWRFASEANNQFRGVDDTRRFHSFHAPFTGTVGSDNCGCAFAEKFRRVVICNIDGSVSPNPVRIRYRNIDNDRYDVWTEVTFNLTNPVANGHHSAQLVDLPDGRLMLVVRTTGPDFDVYHSDDGGDTWELVSEAIIAIFNTPGMATPGHQLDTQFKVARAGEHIRLAWMTPSAEIRTFLSTDRGISWQRLTDLVGFFTDTGHTDDPIPFSMCGVDDSGKFLLVGLGSPSTTAILYFTAAGDSLWFLHGGPTPLAVAVKQIVAVRTPEYIWVFQFFSDTGVSTNDGWAFARARPAAVTDLTNSTGIGWEYLTEAQRYDTGIRYAPGRLAAVWAGNTIFFHGARRDSTATYTDINLPLAWNHGGWTKRSLWRHRPSKPLGDLTGVPLYGRFWTTECDAPNVPAGSPWTVVGTGTVSTNMDEMQIDSTPGNLRRYNRVIAAAGGPAWGQDQDACFGWVVHLDTGDGSLTADEIAVRVFSENTANTTRLDVSLRHAPTGIRVRDNNAAANLDDVLVTLDTGGGGAKYFEVRWWMATQPGGFRGQLAIYDTGTGVWTVGAVVTLTSAAAAGSNEVRFGNLVAPGAGTTTSFWREFWITENGDGHQEGFSNPTSLVGMQMTAGVAVYIGFGLKVQWGGLGGALTDTFDGDVLHTHPAGAIALDSPRLDWRSTGGAAQTLIFDADPENGVNRWVHDAIGLFGCNNRTVLVDYDTDPAFGSPSAVKTVDFTVFGTGTTPLVAFIPLGTSLLLVPASTQQFTKGELVGMYVRVTSGPATGLTWKVTRHDGQNVLYFEEETVDLLTQGLLPGNTMVVFSPNAVLSYPLVANDRYMRLRFLDADTAEGYHTLGTCVPGSRQNVEVPLDWAHTDNEQPNVTQHRTRGAIQWYYQEGPPQRTWTGRMVGDVTQRMRDKMRGLLKSVGYELKPIAWVFDNERPAESCALVRSMGGNQQDNAGWYRDANGMAHTAGDMTITLTEEV